MASKENDSSALMDKSKKLESKKSKSDRLRKKKEGDPINENFSDLELEYEQTVMSTDRVYLVRVFPLFLILIGLFMILVYVFFTYEYSITLYLGIFVTICGIIWKLIMANVEKKRKKEFLFSK